MYSMFQNEWDDYTWLHVMYQSSYNNEIPWYMQRNSSSLFTRVQYVHHKLCNKCLGNTEIPPMSAVALLHKLEQLQLKFGLIAKAKIVALVICRCNPWWNRSERSQDMTGLESWWPMCQGVQLSSSWLLRNALMAKWKWGDAQSCWKSKWTGQSFLSWGHCHHRHQAFCCCDTTLD